VRTLVPAVLALALACHAQQWEIGVASGYGLYRNGSVYAPAGKVVAGFRNRFVFSATLGEDLNKRLAGEFRYTYQDGDPFLSKGETKANIQGQSHAFHYDVLVHLTAAPRRIRPYVAAGIGAKLFVVSGPENPAQPLREIARLVSRDEFKPLVTGGAGLKIRLSRRVLARIDFRDYITPFPKKLIAPAPYGTARGIFHQFTPMAGLSYVF